MFKNISGQKIALFAFNIATGAPQKSDSGNITMYLSKDWGAVTSIANSTLAEIDSTNAAGWYVGSVSSTETNADTILFSGKSATSSVSVVGNMIFTLPPNFTVTSIDASGRVDIGKILGSAVDTTQTQIGVRVNNFNGNAFDSTAAQVGVRVNNFGANALNVNSAQIGVNLVNVLGSVVDTTTVQIGSRLNNIAGAAVNTTSAQLGVNIVNIAGAAVTSAGTQIGVRVNNFNGNAFDSTSAQVGVNLVNIKGSAVDTTVAQVGARVVGNITGSVSGTVGGVAGNVTGSVSGTVGGVAGNVTGSVAGTVGAVAGNVTGSVAGTSDVNIIKITGSAVDTTASQLGVRANVINDKTGYALTSAYDSAKTAAQAGDAMTLTSGERNSISDAMLDRDMSLGADTGSTTTRTVRQALRFLRNKWTADSTTLTVYKEDDGTVSWTGALSTDSTAVPITGNDPAG